MSFAEAALFILCLAVLMLCTGICVYLWFENQERLKFKVEAKALIEAHNNLVLGLQKVEKVAQEAQIGVNYLKSKEAAGRGARG